MAFFDPGAIPATGGSVTCGLSASLTSSTTQIELVAVWSNDVSGDGSTGDWVDHTVGVQDVWPWRGLIKFDITQVPDGIISKAELILQTNSVVGNGADTYRIGPYADDGLADPVVDTGIVRWNRANITLNPFVNNDIAQRTLGAELWDLGSVAIVLIQQAIDLNLASFSLALNQLLESGSNHYTAFAGYLHATVANRPKLRLTYSGGKTVRCSVSASLVAHKIREIGIRGVLKKDFSAICRISGNILAEGVIPTSGTRLCSLQSNLSATAPPPTVIIVTLTCGIKAEIKRRGVWVPQEAEAGVELIIIRS